MNLWLRMLWYLATLHWRPGLRLPGDVSVVRFRVWPTDLDTSIHMNNGRYLTLMDLGRLDLMVSSGLWRAVLRHRWTPIASGILIRFRRELRLWQGMRLESRIVCWEDATVVIEQTFFIEGGKYDGQVASRALFKGGLYDRGARRFIEIERLMSEIGIKEASPVPTPEIDAFLHADDQLKQSAATRT